MEPALLLAVMGTAMNSSTALMLPATNCTGESALLPLVQCHAWQAVFDSTRGGSWVYCSDKRADPCSCEGFGGNYVCNTDGTAITHL